MSNVGQIYKIRVLIDFVTDLYDLQRVPAQCDERGLCWMLRMREEAYKCHATIAK